METARVMDINEKIWANEHRKKLIMDRLKDELETIRKSHPAHREKRDRDALKYATAFLDNDFEYCWEVASDIYKI